VSQVVAGTRLVSPTGGNPPGLRLAATRGGRAPAGALVPVET